MEIISEEEKMVEQELMIYRPPELCQSYPWLVICDREEKTDRQTFCSILEDRYEFRVIPELQNKKICCSYREWLVLKDNHTHDCSMLNILTMEKLQLPPLEISKHYQCVLLPERDGGWLIFFLEGHLFRSRSCHLSDTYFLEHDLHIIEDDMLLTATNFEGKLYALTMFYHLYSIDLSDDYIDCQPVIQSGLVYDSVSTSSDMRFYLVESSGELLVIFVIYWHYKAVDIKIFKANFHSGQWERLDRIGDRAIFLDAYYGYSSPASVNGLKGNSIYIVNKGSRYLYVYDIEDQSFNMSMPCPVADPRSTIIWMHVPNRTNRHNSDKSCVAKEVNYRPTKFSHERLWSDLPNNLLCEIFSRLLPRDRVVFRSVSKFWSSVGEIATQGFELECSYPYLLFSNHRTFHPILEESHYMGSPHVSGATVLCGPIYDKFHHMDFLELPGSLVRVAKDGWLLMSLYCRQIFFFNPMTKEEIYLPDLDGIPMSLYFSSPPTSDEWLVVVCVLSLNEKGIAVQTMKCGDDSWSYCEFFPPNGKFKLSYYNIVVYKGLYYLLGEDAKLLIFDPKTQKFHLPNYVHPCDSCGEQYMLVTEDEKLLAVFVGCDGSSVRVCQWNISQENWETLESLGDLLLFVSLPLSLCTRATRRGTGNKIYFPRLVGSHCLYYSLTTKRLHTSTFSMETSYDNFVGLKEYRHAFWMT